MLNSKCRATYDVRRFPFDVQDLEVFLTVVDEGSNVSWEFDIKHLSNLAQKNIHCETPEWRMVPGSMYCQDLKMGQKNNIDSEEFARRKSAWQAKRKTMKRKTKFEMGKTGTNRKSSVDEVDEDEAFFLAQERENRNLTGSSVHIIQFKVKATRIWQGYIWNFYLVFGLVTTLCFSSFAWNPRLSSEVDIKRNPYDQITISLLVLLTLITFKANFASFLPRVGYVTHLDKYVFGCLVINTLNIFAHCFLIVSGVDQAFLYSRDPEAAKAMRDKWHAGEVHNSIDPSTWNTEWRFTAGIAFIWLLFNIWYWNVSRRYVRENNRKIQRAEEEEV